MAMIAALWLGANISWIGYGADSCDGNFDFPAQPKKGGDTSGMVGIGLLARSGKVSYNILENNVKVMRKECI